VDRHLVGTNERPAAAAVFLLGDEGGVGVIDELAAVASIGDQGKVFSTQSGELRLDFLIRVDAVGIEYNARAADRRHEQQRAAGGQDALQFGHRFSIAARIQVIAVAPQTDVFDNMHAGERLQGSIRKRQLCEIAGANADIWQAEFRRAVIIVFDGADGGRDPYEP